MGIPSHPSLLSYDEVDLGAFCLLIDYMTVARETGGFYQGRQGNGQ